MTPVSEDNLVLVIGAGLAGLTVALQLADHRPIVVLAKRKMDEAATVWAQGGIVGLLNEEDSVENHVSDTQAAGVGLVDESVARFVAQQSVEAIQWLIHQGVSFTRNDQPKAGETPGLHLTQEGGHSQRRIAHVDDATGYAIHSMLLSKAEAHPNITMREHCIALDLITDRHRDDMVAQPAVFLRPQTRYCYGAYVLDMKQQKIETLTASAIVLACGGVGKVYQYTTNPDTATGDGIAMAWRAGCRIANMEFIQFHPTCLYHPEDRTFLISEALRGEGAQLQSPDGTRFMPNYDARAELAPRDIVARAIDSEIKRQGIDFVYVDARPLGESFLQTHFPTIYARCLSLGINIAHQRIPVVPAAHYTCGGIVTNCQGQTDIESLYAVGETAYTGLHGANRLASNSLLECVVLGQSVAQVLLKTPPCSRPSVKSWDESQVEDADEQVVIAHNWDELRLLMANYVGIARTTRRLERALHRIQLLRREVHEYYANFRVTRDLIELRNLLECAELIVLSALNRHESRGLHYNQDYPNTYRVTFPTLLTPKPQHTPPQIND